jgi:hypothetical protein
MALFIADAVISIFIIKIQILMILMVILKIIIILWMITINGQFCFSFKLEIVIMYSMLYNNQNIIDI